MLCWFFILAIWCKYADCVCVCEQVWASYVDFVSCWICAWQCLQLTIWTLLVTSLIEIVNLFSLTVLTGTCLVHQSSPSVILATMGMKCLSPTNVERWQKFIMGSLYPQYTNDLISTSATSVTAPQDAHTRLVLQVYLGSNTLGSVLWVGKSSLLLRY